MMKPLILALSLASLLAAETVTDPFEPRASNERKPERFARITDPQGSPYFPEGTGLISGRV